MELNPKMFKIQIFSCSMFHEPCPCLTFRIRYYKKRATGRIARLHGIGIVKRTGAETERAVASCSCSRFLRHKTKQLLIFEYLVE